eukprot:6004488-Pyramimonas_sp.AAC.1
MLAGPAQCGATQVKAGSCHLLGGCELRNRRHFRGVLRNDQVPGFQGKASGCWVRYREGEGRGSRFT